MPIKKQQQKDTANISVDMKDFNNNLIVSRYESIEPLSSIEKKIMNRIDVELSHKDPTSNFVVSGGKDNKYNMNYVSGRITIAKECKDKETCFKKLRAFILSLREMPL